MVFEVDVPFDTEMVRNASPNVAAMPQQYRHNVKLYKTVCVHERAEAQSPKAPVGT